MTSARNVFPQCIHELARALDQGQEDNVTWPGHKEGGSCDDCGAIWSWLLVGQEDEFLVLRVFWKLACSSVFVRSARIVLVLILFGFWEFGETDGTMDAVLYGTEGRAL